MRRRFIIALTLLMLFSNCLFAIGFGYSVLDLKIEPNFGNGTFPTGLIYQFNIPMPNFISGNDTLFTFRLNNGLEYRTLYQNPEDGRLIDGDKELYEAFYIPEARQYTTHYDELKLLLEQGLFGHVNSSDDFLKLHVGIGGRYEMAFERFSWMADSQSTEGLFWIDIGVPRYDSSISWMGAPELKGKRSIFQTFADFGLKLNMLNDKQTVKNGIKAESLFRMSPSSMPLSDGSANFYSLNNNLSIAYTPFAIYQKNKPEFTNFSLTLGSDFDYRIIWGDKIPYYIQGGAIYGAHVPNAKHVLTNRSYIAIFGPQLAAPDFYPVLTLFHDMGWSVGQLLNSVDADNINKLACSVGVKAELNIYNICRIYYRVGYLYKTPFDSISTGKIQAEFRFTLEV